MFFSICTAQALVDLSTVAASLGKSGLAAGGLAEHNIAGAAEDDGLGVAKYGGDLEASGALDVHEEAIGVCTRRLSLCVLASASAVGLSKSTGIFINKDWLYGGKSREYKK